MNNQFNEAIHSFMDILQLKEEPLGIFFSDIRPEIGYGMKPSELPTREKELKNEINWQAIFSKVSCVMGNIKRARRKQIPAYFSDEQFGCPGAAFWMGFMKPPTETIVHYVSTGIPGKINGEFYCDSPDQMRNINAYVDPQPIERKYCIFKPLNQFAEAEKPELVVFFTTPESLCGDPEVVVSPWSAGCGSLLAWPRHYSSKGLDKAVLGGWDPSARKFFKKEELSFTISFQMFKEMINRYEESFLTKDVWNAMSKRISKEEA